MPSLAGHPDKALAAPLDRPHPSAVRLKAGGGSHHVPAMSMELAQIPTDGWRRLRSVEERALNRGVKVEVYGCVMHDGRSLLVIESHTGITASMQRGEVITQLTPQTAEAVWMAARTCIEGARA